MTRLRGGGIVEDVGRLGHFDHEGALAPAQFVAGADAREDAIGDADLRASAGTKLPIWARSVSRATWRINVLLPDMLGPVISQRHLLSSGRPKQDIVGHERARRQR